MRNNQIKKGFNRLSFVYDRLSQLVFGRQLNVAQDYFIDGIKSGSSVLVVGGGTGKSLSAIFKHHSYSKITFLDISSGMLAKARGYVQKNHRSQLEHITFIEGTFEQLPETENYDVIITPFILDCLDDKTLDNTLTGLYGKLNNNGEWLFTDFNVPPRPVYIKWAANGIVLSLYLFFNMFCKLGVSRLPDFSKHFSRLFVHPQETNYFLRGLLVSQRYVKLDIMKSQEYE